MNEMVAVKRGTVEDATATLHRARRLLEVAAEKLKLETVDDVSAALLAIIEARHARGRGSVKPAQLRFEAARLADLYEIRASMWNKLGTAARQNDLIPDGYATACAVAEGKDRDNVIFWRREAGRR